jgi:uncharacterized protein (TIGR02246 family)
MNRVNHFKSALTCIALFFAVACSETKTDETANKNAETEQATAATADPAKLKAEIQELETAWADADNKRDVNTLAAFYSDDAVSMNTEKPMLIGNAAIKKDLEEGFTKRPQGSTVSYEVMDVFGSGNYVTETGKFTRKDSTGKTASTGKYMAIWEKRNGKWICIRDISNDDAKKK